jgi:hypothetical protein
MLSFITPILHPDLIILEKDHTRRAESLEESYINAKSICIFKLITFLNCIFRLLQDYHLLDHSSQADPIDQLYTVPPLYPDP